MLMMPFTYSITNGIGMGFITFSVLRLAAGRGREVPVAMHVVSAVFAFYYLMPALGLTSIPRGPAPGPRGHGTP
ncbi:hypothetical protein SVIOM342S_10588 [Streptomyces violaceorubidus]